MLNLVTVLSLLLCVAVCVIWVRSYRHSDILLLRRVDPGPDGGVRCSQVSLGWRTAVIYFGLHRWTWTGDDPPAGGSSFSTVSSPAGSGRWDAGFDPGTVRWQIGRFTWVADPPDRGAVSKFLTVPAWAAAIAFAALPVAWLYRRLRPRYSRGQCPRCGYDLRATPDRCPECGEEGRAGL